MHFLFRRFLLFAGLTTICLCYFCSPPVWLCVLTVRHQSAAYKVQRRRPAAHHPRRRSWQSPVAYQVSWVTWSEWREKISRNFFKKKGKKRWLVLTLNSEKPTKRFCNHYDLLDGITGDSGGKPARRKKMQVIVSMTGIEYAGEDRLY